MSSKTRGASIDKTPRINEQIRISPVRVIGPDGKMIGILPTLEALDLAQREGLDLVEVNPNERPPVCRIMDYGKYKYEQKKRQQQQAKQHQVHVKEIRLRPKTGAHDIEVKVKRARKFLEAKDKVRVNVLFRGREHAHREIGQQMLEDIAEQLSDVAKIEKPPSLEGGRVMAMVLAPK
ncbi:MAG: translation initiation factor IF-3 [Planctomycetota bacterium]|nr:MAG: translation initiation factor IF-3 [Planctomycetota bacterium]